MRGMEMMERKRKRKEREKREREIKRDKFIRFNLI